MLRTSYCIKLGGDQRNLKPPFFLSFFLFSFLVFFKLLYNNLPLIYTGKLLFHQSLSSTVTTRWLDSDGVVNIINCQYSIVPDYTVGQLCCHPAASSCQPVNHDCTVTVQSPCHPVGLLVTVSHRWLMEKGFWQQTMADDMYGLLHFSCSTHFDKYMVC